MSIARNVVTAVVGTIAALAATTLALVPAVVIADSSTPGAESDTVHQAAAPDLAPSDFPWN